MLGKLSNQKPNDLKKVLHSLLSINKLIQQIVSTLVLFENTLFAQLLISHIDRVLTASSHYTSQ